MIKPPDCLGVPFSFSVESSIKKTPFGIIYLRLAIANKNTLRKGVVNPCGKTLIVYHIQNGIVSTI